MTSPSPPAPQPPVKLPAHCPLGEQPIMRETLVAAAHDILDDKELMARFWRGGYESLVDHAVDGSARYLGKRILTWIITTCAVFLAWIALKTGVFKP